jgi:hypothetical protein
MVGLHGSGHRRAAQDFRRTDTSAAGKARSAQNASKDGLNVPVMYDPDVSAEQDSLSRKTRERSSAIMILAVQQNRIDNKLCLGRPEDRRSAAWLLYPFCLG